MSGGGHSWCDIMKSACRYAGSGRHKGIMLEFDSTERDILTPIPAMANTTTSRSLISNSIYDERDS